MIIFLHKKIYTYTHNTHKHAHQISLSSLLSIFSQNRTVANRLGRRASVSDHLLFVLSPFSRHQSQSRPPSPLSPSATPSSNTAAIDHRLPPTSDHPNNNHKTDLAETISLKSWTPVTLSFLFICLSVLYVFPFFKYAPFVFFNNFLAFLYWFCINFVWNFALPRCEHLWWTILNL